MGAEKRLRQSLPKQCHKSSTAPRLVFDLPYHPALLLIVTTIGLHHGLGTLEVDQSADIPGVTGRSVKRWRLPERIVRFTPPNGFVFSDGLNISLYILQDAELKFISCEAPGRGFPVLLAQ